MGKVHLHCEDFSACGLCGPAIRFSRELKEVDCKRCLNAIELEGPRGWRLKNPFVEPPGICRDCGCTEGNACHDSMDPSIGCHWVEDTLCSECA